MSKLTQENRTIAISDFSLGKDTFLLTSFEGGEFISDTFEFQIEVLSENLEVKPDSILGKTCTITIQDKLSRVFHGHIRSFSFGEIKTSHLRQYKMTMVPWLWFLTKTNNHRIFQNKNTKDIVSQVFKDLGFSDFDFRASGGKKREYCVQHNESDFNFVSRLLEEEGIAYYFVHEKSKHKLILVDQKNAYDVVEESDLEYSKGSASLKQITRWEHTHSYKKGQWSFTDYNFKEPTKNLFANDKSTSKFADNNKFEHYEYPGIYDYASGSDLIKIRLDAEEADRDVVHGSSECASFYAGGVFKLAKHTTKSEKGEYILVGVYHKAADTSYFSGDNGNTGYVNDFSAIPSSIHFRPQIRHKKPYMQGPQSALVVGPSGEEIYTDEFGRIKAQFYWDREGQKNENSSCFIRVVQAWAGAEWGSSFIPRIGHEVIITFLDGDPDRPLVTGSVYNGKNKPTFESKTQSGFKSRSTKGGNAQNFNELRFDDKKDDEQIYIHAEKNMDIKIENNQTVIVDNDRNKDVKNNETYTIAKDRKKDIGNNQSENIGKNKSTNVGGDHGETIDGSMSITVKKDLIESIKKDYTENVAGEKKSVIKKDLTENIDSNHTENVKKDYVLKAKKVQITAQDEISFKTGSASILMKKNGDITIKGKKITVKGSSDVIIKGSKIKEN